MLAEYLLPFFLKKKSTIQGHRARLRERFIHTSNDV